MKQQAARGRHVTCLALGPSKGTTDPEGAFQERCTGCVALCEESRGNWNEYGPLPAGFTILVSKTNKQKNKNTEKKNHCSSILASSVYFACRGKV